MRRPRGPDHRILLVAAVVAVLLLLAAPVHAGKRDYVDPVHGFGIKLPAKGDWSQTPTQPGEKTEVAKFKDDRKGAFSTLSVYRFPMKGTITPDMEGSEEEEGDAPPFEIPEQYRPPDNAKDYLVRGLKWTLRQYGKESADLPEPKTVDFEDDLEGELYEIQLEHPRRRGMYYSSLIGIVNNGREEYMVVFTGQQKLKKYARDWTKSIRSFEFPADEEAKEEAAEEFKEDLEDRDRTKRRKDLDLLDPEKREKFKKDLRGGWRYLDTPNYIVLYNCDDGLAKYIGKRVEYMRTHAFEKVFPLVEPVKEAMVIRVCKEMDEYHHYGAPQGSAGYWSAYHDELVFPDLSQSKKPDEKTIGVMHHEAFHQYVYYALLKHNPPVWFNEGYAEYFFCVEGWDKKKPKYMKRHPMRYGTVKSALGTDKLFPVHKFVRLTHREYMRDATLCYAQGWAFAKWLKAVTRNERYREIPQIFFDELQKGYLEQQKEGGLGRFGGGNREQGPVVKKAFERAFEGIDWDEIDEEFKKDLKRKM